MSIKDDFIYLNTTKQLLKTEINKIKNVLDDNSTFRSYPQELFNGYLDILNNGTDTLWSNLEKVSQTGTEAVLEGVETAPMKIELSGNTSQETTSGKNILPSVNLEEKTIDGVTFTPVYKNGLLDYININGTKGSQQNVGYTISNVNFENGEEYTISGVIGFTSVTLQLFTNSSEAFPLGYRLRSTNGKETKTAQADEICPVSLYVYYGNTYDNVKVYPMICKNNTNDTYEPYTNGASPNPDYPQEVKVVKGENTVSVSGKNLVDYLDVKGIGSRDGTNNITLDSSSIDGDLLTINKTYQQGGGILKFNNISLPKIEQGEIVTISFIPNKTIRGVVGISNYNGGGTNNITTYANFVENSMFEISLEALSTYDKLGIFIQGLNQSIGIKNLLVERGSTATPYVPYSKTDYPINLNPNLVDFSTFENGYVDGTNGGIVGRTASHEMVSPFIKVKPSTTYTIKIKDDGNGSPNWFGIGEYTTNAQSGFIFRNTMSSANLPNYSSFITSPTTEYIRASARNLTAGVSEVQLVEGVSLMELPIELCKINTYKDYFHKDSGKWYVHKEFDKIILNENSYWYERNVTISGVSRKIFFSRSDKFKSYVSMQNMLCNYFKVKNTYGTSPTANNQFYNNYERTNNLEFAKFEFTTLTEWKEWVASHNIILVGKLATPTEEEITNTTLIEQLEAIYKAKSVKDKTYISQTNDELPFVLNVEAIKEYNVE